MGRKAGWGRMGMKDKAGVGKGKLWERKGDGEGRGMRRAGKKGGTGKRRMEKVAGEGIREGQGARWDKEGWGEMWEREGRSGDGAAVEAGGCHRGLGKRVQLRRGDTGQRRGAEEWDRARCPQQQGKGTGVKSAKAGPSLHPMDNPTQHLLQLPAPRTSGHKEQMPGSC